MKMRFNDFVFPANPAKLEILLSSNFSSSPVFGRGSSVQNVSVNPAVIKGSGEFYGSRAESSCCYLQHILRLRTAGILFIPSSGSYNAYLTEFNFSRNADKSGIAYSFVFTESCSDRKERRSFCSTVAKEGENAFDIADRCCVSVNEIMERNSFKTPFDINKGDRVMMR